MLHKLQTFAESAIINIESLSFCVVAAEINRRYNLEMEQMGDYETVFFDVWYDSPEEMSQMRLHCENLEEATRLLNEVKELVGEGFISLEAQESGEGMEIRHILIHKNDIQYIKTDEDNTTWIHYSYGEFEVKNFNPKVI